LDSQQTNVFSEDAELEEEVLSAITSEMSIQGEVTTIDYSARQIVLSGSGTVVVDDQQPPSAVSAISENMGEEDIYSDSFSSAVITGSIAGRRTDPSNHASGSQGEGGSSAGISELEAEYNRKIVALKKDLERKRKQVKRVNLLLYSCKDVSYDHLILTLYRYWSSSSDKKRQR
jgi:hypothetical protein